MTTAFFRKWFAKPIRPRIITFANQKGGSGKTTSAMNVTVGLMSCGFKVGTLEGWYEIPDLLAERAGGDVFWATLARVYFIVSVVVIGILGLSLGNAIFVDEMTADNTKLVEDKVDALHAEVRALREELRAGGAGGPPAGPA